MKDAVIVALEGDLQECSGGERGLQLLNSDVH